MTDLALQFLLPHIALIEQTAELILHLTPYLILFAACAIDLYLINIESDKYK